MKQEANATNIEFLQMNSKCYRGIIYLIRLELRLLKGKMAVDGGVNWRLGAFIQ